MDDPLDRRTFLNLAALFEGALALLAVALGWVFGVDPLKDLHWSWPSFGIGVAAVLPMLVVFLGTMWWPVPALRRIRQMLVSLLGPPLSQCRWYELALLAGVVGFCEELLFRGFLQPALEFMGYWPALLGCNILFGAAHFLSPTYAIETVLAGCYLSWLLDAGDTRELLSPMVTHALYDFIAFLAVIAIYRREVRQRHGQFTAA